VDKWDQVTGYCCGTCRFFSPKQNVLGRCRRRSPTLAGYPVVYAEHDWCGDHKIGTNPDKETVHYALDKPTARAGQTQAQSGGTSAVR